MKEVLYVLLPPYPDHELAFLGVGIASHETGIRTDSQYVNKIVGPSLEPVVSIAGLRVLPDYSIKSLPQDFAALVLIGGYGWNRPEAALLSPIVARAIEAGILVGAICNAASWMASQGFLNHVRHTGNGIDELKRWGGEHYQNEVGYVERQAVCDGHIVTANGSASLEFAREMLKALATDSAETIDRYYTFNKEGFVKLMAPRPRFFFNTIGLFTTNNARTVAFYRDIFGFQTTWNGIDPNVEMTLGDSRIILFPRKAFEEMTSHTYSYPSGLNATMEVSFDVPCFADVDKEYHRAINLGAHPIFAPTTEPWGQRTCYVADPDGNLIEISSFTRE